MKEEIIKKMKEYMVANNIRSLDIHVYQNDPFGDFGITVKEEMVRE